MGLDEVLQKFLTIPAGQESSDPNIRIEQNSHEMRSKTS